MHLWGIPDIPEITAAADLPGLLAGACAVHDVMPGDVLVVAHKVVSKAEGQMIVLADVIPGHAARELAQETGKDPRLCEVILGQTRRIVRQRGSTLICETHHGFVCANAAVDSSNTPPGTVIVLPVDPDRSARHIQKRVSDAIGGRVAVVITDTHGRAFRRGIVNIAIGIAGFRAVVDHRGTPDREGRVMVATEQALGDELAAAAGILMDKAGGVPAVVIRGVATEPAPGDAGELVRDPAADLFRATDITA
jgi:coenzyme F420-0:L-glutamate ligase/coenzyme F420-1:gamma-L-glutamate ligase